MGVLSSHHILIYVHFANRRELLHPGPARQLKKNVGQHFILELLYLLYVKFKSMTEPKTCATLNCLKMKI